MIAKKETQKFRRMHSLCIKCGVKVEKHLMCALHKKEFNSRKGYDPVAKREYYLRNKKAILKTHASYVKKKYKEDAGFRLRRNILGRLQEVIKSTNGKKMFSISKNMGCTYDELVQHLENEFYQHPETDEYMSWDNYGVKGWHLDHIIPLTFFNLEDDTQFKLANHFTNLRPMWADANIKKSNSLDDDSFLHSIQLEEGFFVIMEGSLNEKV